MKGEFVLAAREEVIEVEEVVLEAEAVEEPQPDDPQELPQPSRLPARLNTLRRRGPTLPLTLPALSRRRAASRSRLKPTGS